MPNWRSSLLPLITWRRFFENREQIEISKFYERMPKPSTMATEEFVNDEILFRDKVEEEETTESEL
jgi:hypothetical protein